MGRKKEEGPFIYPGKNKISSTQLDDFARKAGYEGDNPQIFNRLKIILQKEGLESFQDYLVSYLTGIKFLIEHPNGFNQQELTSATMNGILGGPGLAVLSQLHNAINYSPEAERPQNQAVFL